MKNTYKIYLTVIFCFITLTYGFPDDTPLVTTPVDPIVTTQTPERGQFPTLMDNFSVNHFTGQPNIEIPLYTVEAYDIQVPIALKYRTGGLRVDVEDSYVGINWDLVVGGEIRRTVVGLPDNFNSTDIRGYPYINQSITGYSYQDRKSFIDKLKNENQIFSPYYLDCDMVKLSELYGPQYSDGRFDTGPDIYNFNIMGISGTFTGGIGGGVHNLQTNEWVYISKENDGFRIRDAKGYTYIFNEKEWHRYKYRLGYYGDMSAWNTKPMQKYDYVISWKLSEIISPTGESVLFIYDTHTIVDPRVEEAKYSSRSSYSNMYIPAKCYNETSRIEANVHYSLFSDRKDENKDEYTYKYLTKISSNNSRVEFKYLVQPQQVPKLSTIEVYVINSPDSRIKKYVLNNGSWYTNQITSVKEYGRGEEYNEYKFSYYSDIPFVRFTTGKKRPLGILFSRCTGICFRNI